MNEPLISVRLDGRRRSYAPGDRLAGEFRIVGLDPDDIRAVEVSVLWYTEGKGDEDLNVHHFERLEAVDEASFQRHHRFTTQLPHSPLSYEGVLVKLQWCVRVRVFLPRGKSLVHEEPFRLGAVPRAAAVVHEEATQAVP